MLFNVLTVFLHEFSIIIFAIVPKYGIFVESEVASWQSLKN